jgi:hypothetical protein
MFGKLLNLLVAAAMLAAVAWHYRDTEPVQKRRPLIESVLSKAGIHEDTVRHYWPLDGGAPAAAADDPNPRFNLIESLRNQLDASGQAQRQRDDSLRQTDK